MSRPLLIFLAVFAVIAVLLFFLPLRMAIGMADLEGENFSAKLVTGSVWNGQIEGAKLGPAELGDIDAGMQFWPLLTGTAKLDLSREASDLNNALSATIGKNSNSFFVENAVTTISLGQELAPLPTSNIDLEGVDVAFANGRCQSASGKIRVSLDANIPGLDLQRGLLGNAECQDGVLVLPLASSSGMEKLTLKLDGEGAYTARLSVSGGNLAWTLLLPTLGFTKTPDGYAIKIAGQLGQKII